MNWRQQGAELYLAGMPGFEPRKSVLETDVIAVSPHPYKLIIPNLLHFLCFLVVGYLSAIITKLL